MTHTEILEAALIGYALRLSSVQEKIAQIKATLGGEPETVWVVKRRKFSAATRTKMSESQRKRWEWVKKRRG